MKVAYLFMGEMRLVKQTIKKVYDYIFDYYDVDIYVLAQRSSDKDEEIIKLLDRRVVHKELYDKPDPKTFFEDENLENYPNENWNINACTQYYINMKKMANLIDKIKDKYDFYMTQRVDIDILFPYPSLELFNILQPVVYDFDATYCRHWGGYATGFFIHKNYIIDYLTAPYDLISNKNKDDLNNYLNGSNILNQENLMKYAFFLKKIPFKYIKNLNSFFTCENINSRTTSTWGIPKYHPVYNVICKYAEQCEEAYKNFEKWNGGAKWVFKNDSIFLEKQRY